MSEKAVLTLDGYLRAKALFYMAVESRKETEKYAKSLAEFLGDTGGISDLGGHTQDEIWEHDGTLERLLKKLQIGVDTEDDTL